MFDRFSDHAKRAMSHARLEALRLGHGLIDARHLALSLTGTPDPVVSGILTTIGVDREGLIAKLGALPSDAVAGPHADALPFTRDGKLALQCAVEFAMLRMHSTIEPVHLLVGVVSAAEKPLRSVLAEAGLTREALLQMYGAIESELSEANASAAPRDPHPAIDVFLDTAQGQLRGLIDEAVAGQRFAVAEVLRDLFHRMKQAHERLRSIDENPD